MDGLHPRERDAIDDFLGLAVIGGPDTVRAGLLALKDATQVDEFLFVCDIFEPPARSHALELVAAACLA
jgi:alkanesulfonate monooxygenase SsuD/methylene tetrahydromethanopterin reductase-like flavin-dependent oxidoreductase (luciferase family)